MVLLECGVCSEVNLTMRSCKPLWCLFFWKDVLEVSDMRLPDCWKASESKQGKCFKADALISAVRLAVNNRLSRGTSDNIISAPEQFHRIIFWLQRTCRVLFLDPIFNSFAFIVYSITGSCNMMQKDFLKAHNMSLYCT